MMRFILIYLKLYLFKALLIQSFLFHPPFSIISKPLLSISFTFQKI